MLNAYCAYGDACSPAHDDGNTPSLCVGNRVGLSGVEQRRTPTPTCAGPSYVV